MPRTGHSLRAPVVLRFVYSSSREKDSQQSVRKNMHRNFAWRHWCKISNSETSSTCLASVTQTQTSWGREQKHMLRKDVQVIISRLIPSTGWGLSTVSVNHNTETELAETVGKPYLCEEFETIKVVQHICGDSLPPSNLLRLFPRVRCAILEK